MSPGKTCFTSWISPSLTRFASTAKTARATRSGSVDSSLRISCANPGEELFLVPLLERLAGGIPPFVVEAAHQHGELRSQLRNLLDRQPIPGHRRSPR